MANDGSDLKTDPWTDSNAKKLAGSIVLVGITYVDKDNKPCEQLEFYGIVLSAKRSRGIAIECQNEKKRGETFWLPPQIDVFQPAPRGTYRLRSTGEVIVDPDYTCSYTIIKAEHQPN
jgi:hypothetical protein